MRRLAVCGVLLAYFALIACTSAPKDEATEIQPDNREIPSVFNKPVPAVKMSEEESLAIRDSIRSVVRSHIKKIRNCYEEAKKERPGIHGRVNMQWVIAKDGRVSDAKPKDMDAGMEPVAECLSREIGDFEFAKRSSVQEIVYPFVFSETK